LLIGALVVPLLVPAGLTGPVDAAAAAVPVEVEAPDFASEVHSDPWDYANAEDQNTDAARVQSISLSGGGLTMGVRGGDWFTPVSSVAGAIPYGRDGSAASVDTGRYQRLSFRMDQPSSGTGAIVWFTCPEQAESCGGGITFPLRPGDQVYDLDLTAPSVVAAKVPWSSARVVNLRVIPSVTQSLTRTMSVSVDWLRLYAPTSSHGRLPPGQYVDVTVTPRPRPVVDSPDVDEGRDLAAAQRGASWDFTRSSGVSGIRFLNARVGSYSSAGTAATNSGPTVNDPQVVLPVAPFSADAYHHLSFELDYDGPFSLADAPGGGKLARLIWIARGAGNFQEGDDVVTWSGANSRRVEIDLSQGDPLDPTSSAPRLGWSGQTMEFLRFDPNEDPGAASWQLRSFHLRADPAAQGSTTVRFHDDAWVPGTLADVKVGTGVPGSGYETIAAKVPVQQGANAVTFDLGARPAGSYRVEVVLSHPEGGRAKAFSRTPISMAPRPGAVPQGALDEVRRVPGGVEVAGWARDADTTSPIDVHLYDDLSGAFLGPVTASVPRPDVRAATGAQLSTGFRTVVRPMAGPRRICAYGINVQGGQNALLGCRSIVVDDGLPRGALDSVTRIPGGLRATGWALDPDSAGPASVHVYAGARGAAVTADRERRDVARAYPGYGPGHGFAADMARTSGTYSVCAYAIDTGGAGAPSVGCRTTTLDPKPIGSFDSAVRSGGQVALRGWALDPDTAGAVDVAVHVDGRQVALIRADARRPDVGRAHLDWGAEHGFSTSVTAPRGSTVCTYGMDSTRGENTTLGCRSV